MVFKWIAIAVVVCLMMGFVLVSVIWTAQVVSRNIRKRTIDLLSFYDGVLEQRGREISRREKQIEEKLEAASTTVAAVQEIPASSEAEPVNPSSFLKAAEQICLTDYQTEGMSEAYRRIRQNFAAPTPQFVQELSGKTVQNMDTRARRILDILPFDAVYELSSLPESDQLSLLRETIPADVRSFLEEYVESAGRFDAIAFYDAVRSAAQSQQCEPVLHVSAHDAGQYPEGIKVTVDEGICEGYQYELGNVLYDFSIKTGEIG